MIENQEILNHGTILRVLVESLDHLVSILSCMRASYPSIGPKDIVNRSNSEM